MIKTLVYARYEMEVDISMSTATGLWRRNQGDSFITLTADHSFVNFTRGLQPGDRVWFAGLLAGDQSGLLTRSVLLTLLCSLHLIVVVQFLN